MLGSYRGSLSQGNKFHVYFYKTHSRSHRSQVLDEIPKLSGTIFVELSPFVTPGTLISPQVLKSLLATRYPGTFVSDPKHLVMLLGSVA
jgi:hypothetical protein